MKKPFLQSLPCLFDQGRLFVFCFVALLSFAPSWSIGAATTQNQLFFQTAQPSPDRLGPFRKNSLTHSYDPVAAAPACADSLSETHAYDAPRTLPSPPDLNSRHSLIPALLPHLASRRSRRRKPLDRSTKSPSQSGDWRAKYAYDHHPSPRRQTERSRHPYRQINVLFWPSRDPIGERGGVNLYAMVGNDAVGKRDYLGLYDYNLDWLDNVGYGRLSGLPFYELEFDCRCTLKFTCSCQNSDGTTDSYRGKRIGKVYIWGDKKGFPLKLDPYLITREKVNDLYSYAVTAANSKFLKKMKGKVKCVEGYKNRLTLSFCK